MNDVAKRFLPIVQATVETRPARADAYRSPSSDGDRRLKLLDKLRQRTIQSAIRRVASGETLEAPLVVELDVTSVCDLACPECISSDVINKGGFTTSRVIELAHEIVELGVRAVILIGGGEPLLHPAVGSVLEILGRGGVEIGVTTNGTLIDRRLDALAEHAAWVRVSMDAGTSATYGRFRPHKSGKSVFDSVVENMRALAARKRGALGYSFLLIARRDDAGNLLDSNYGDVLAAGRLAKDIGCNYFEVKPMYDMNHFMCAPPASLVPELEAQLATVRELADASFSVIAPKSTQSVVLDQGPTSQPKSYKRCLVSQLRVLITPNGAYVCPYFRGAEHKLIGQPAEQSLREIWAGQQREQGYRALDPSKDCQFHCIRHESNLLLEEVARGRELDVIDDYDFFL